MDKKRTRTYNEEFKRQAVELADDLGSAMKAAKQLGISDANIHNWRMKIKTGQSLSGTKTPVKPIADAPKPASAEEENARLRKKIAELEKVNHILKAAAAIFTRDHLS
mgnify:FL=1